MLPLAFAVVFAAAPELWIGHQVVWGTAPVPWVGERPTRTDSYVLAHVERRDGSLHMVHDTCRVDIAPVAGVRTALPPETYPLLPRVPFILKPQGNVWVGTWDAAWTAADHDQDGHPGVSVSVDVPLCRGQVYVASQSKTSAEARFVGDKLEGEVQVRFQQQVLGASNPCLSLTAADTHDSMRGVVRYRPVQTGQTCAEIDPILWPEVD